MTNDAREHSNFHLISFRTGRLPSGQRELNERRHSRQTADSAAAPLMRRRIGAARITPAS